MSLKKGTPDTLSLYLPPPPLFKTIQFSCERILYMVLPTIEDWLMFIGLIPQRDNPLVRANSTHRLWCFSTTVVTMANSSGCADRSVYRSLLLHYWHRVFESYSEQDCKNVFLFSYVARGFPADPSLISVVVRNSYTEDSEPNTKLCSLSHICSQRNRHINGDAEHIEWRPCQW
jgi:hypothetical protein